jgi:hypothetical protein
VVALLFHCVYYLRFRWWIFFDANLMSLGAIDSVLLLMEPSLLLSSLRFK